MIAFMRMALGLTDISPVAGRPCPVQEHLRKLFKEWRRTVIPDNSNTFPRRLRTMSMEGLVRVFSVCHDFHSSLWTGLFSRPSRPHTDVNPTARHPRRPLPDQHQIGYWDPWTVPGTLHPIPYSSTSTYRRLYAHARTTERPRARDTCGSWVIPMLLRHNTERPRLSPPDDSASGTKIGGMCRGPHVFLYDHLSY